MRADFEHAATVRGARSEVSDRYEHRSEAERQAELISAWLAGYAQAQLEVAQLLHAPTNSTGKRQREHLPGKRRLCYQTRDALWKVVLLHPLRRDHS